MFDNCGYFVRNKNLQQLRALFTSPHTSFGFMKYRDNLITIGSKSIFGELKRLLFVSFLLRRTYNPSLIRITSGPKLVTERILILTFAGSSFRIYVKAKWAHTVVRISCRNATWFARTRRDGTCVSCARNSISSKAPSAPAPVLSIWAGFTNCILIAVVLPAVAWMWNSITLCAEDISTKFQ